MTCLRGAGDGGVGVGVGVRFLLVMADRWDVRTG